MILPKDIIQRCHKRHTETLRQRKTVATPALYKKIPYNLKIYCARRYPVMLDHLKQAAISFMPIGHAPYNDQGPTDFDGDQLSEMHTTQRWELRQWCESWGIQVFTGMPSKHDGALWHDLHFTYQAICTDPDAVFTCLQILINSVANPLLTLTKSAGLRFTCRIPDYLHPHTAEAKSYIYKHAPTSDNPNHREVYLEILGEDGYSQWDSRYEILLGDLLAPPVIAKEMLFTPIDTLRATLHAPELLRTMPVETEVQTAPVVPQSLGSRSLDLAKEALLKRGFAYLRQGNDFYHWVRPNSRMSNDTQVTLWEDRDIVWVRADTADTEVPTRTTPITDVWNDTGITPPILNSGMPVTKKLISIREGKLSPLAIKRTPILHQQKSKNKVYKTPEENAEQIRQIFQKDTRILGITPETFSVTNQAIETYLLNGGSIYLNTPSEISADVIEQRYQELNLPSFARWKSRLYRWEKVKDIPVDVRMGNPFVEGNVCEDPERCHELTQKGGDPLETICPSCPVYTTCQERGFLSQLLALQAVKALILPSDLSNQLLINPEHADTIEQFLKTTDGTERICIVDERKTKIEQLFINCRLSTKVVKEWSMNWEGATLGNFAKALLSVIELYDRSDGNPITRIRAVMQAFQPHEEELIQQMCHLNVKCQVVKNGFVDSETGEKLAQFSILFEDSVSAYIPVDNNAAEKLKTKGLPFFQPRTFVLNKTMNIPMKMHQAVQLGILDAGTAENIRQFPTVCQNPNWTAWHQLKRLFAYYNPSCYLSP